MTLTIQRLLICLVTWILLAVMATIYTNNVIALLYGIPAYLILPGTLMQIVIRRKFSFDLNFILYSVGLSLLYWILGGLLVDLALPIFGVLRPLRLEYILPFYGATLLVLSLMAFRLSYKHHITFDKNLSLKWTMVAGIPAMIFPVISVLGSTTLNNGGSGFITISMLAGICCYILFLVIRRERVDVNVYPIAIYGLGLALLLMYSMRTWHVLGWDIHNELRVFASTYAQDRWQMSSFPGSAYNACLSITILPTIFAKLFHLSPEYVFKFLYQVVFAILPLTIYSVARRYLETVLAFLAAILFIGQIWFFELMPALARQEIALVFFALFLVGLGDQSISRTFRRWLLMSFSTGLIVAHYSSAYIWLIMCCLAYVIIWIVRMFSAKARESPRALTWTILLFGTAFLYLWEGPITGTAGQAGMIATNVGPELSQAFTPKVIAKGVKSALIAPPANNNDTTVTQAYKFSIASRVAKPGLYFSPTTYASYRPRAENTEETAQNYLPGIVNTVVLLGSTLIKSVVSNIMTAIGVMILMWGYFRKKFNSSPDFIVLSAVAYLLIVAMLMIPFLQQVYNLTRLGLQMFILLVIPAIAGVSAIARHTGRFRLTIVAVVVVIVVALQTGLTDQIAGGNLRITLNQSRGTFESYVVKEDEIYSAKWLDSKRQAGVPVFSDDMAALRLESYTGINPTIALFPPSLVKNSYVYLIDSNIVRNKSYYAFNNSVLTVNTPIDFLRRNKNLIYSSGGSEIFR